jgi:hypothetical protein
MEWIFCISMIKKKLKKELQYFLNEEFKVYLKEIKNWMLGVIFSSAPRDLFQVLTFQGFLFDSYLPPIFVLLPSKSEEIYVKTFKILNSSKCFSQEVIISDFELANVKSCQLIFPNVTNYGCNFHFSQSLYRYIVQEGYKMLYNTNFEYRKIVRMINESCIF